MQNLWFSLPFLHPASLRPLQKTFVRHDLPFVNPCWLLFKTLYSARCSVISLLTILSITLHTMHVRLTGSAFFVTVCANTAYPHLFQVTKNNNYLCILTLHIINNMVKWNFKLASIRSFKFCKFCL